jgi:hypothetical protein
LPWSLLIIGALASLGANIAVAEPTIIGRVTVPNLPSQSSNRA